MKIIILTISVVLIFTAVSFAENLLYEKTGRSPLLYERPYQDTWGNRYKHRENLYRDTDRDGVLNYHDYNDRNPRIQTPYQSDLLGTERPKRKRSIGLLD